jgi:uncharacterized protein Yka (UPF0111/DUF47 family)
MFSLGRRLGQEAKVLELLEASAREGLESVQALAKMTKATDEPPILDEFRRLRLSNKQIAAEVRSAVYGSFGSGIDRQDMDELSFALYKVPKMVDKFAERLTLSLPGVDVSDFSTQIGLLERATEVLGEMVRALRRMELKRIGTLNGKLQNLQEEADEEMMRLYGDLFNGGREVVEVIALKGLYEQLEKLMDRCCEAGGVIAYIGLKNS